MEKRELPTKTIVDLEMLNTLNARGCPACEGRFSLGEPVVAACGAWGTGMKYIHENEAVFDSSTDCYVERTHYHNSKRR